MKQDTTLPIAGALVFGLLAGWLDVNSQEVQLPALMVIAFSAAFGSMSPRRAWLIGLLMGGGVAIFGIGARLLGVPPAGPAPDPWWTGILMPVLIALAAAYLGAGMRWLIRRGERA